MNPLELSQQVAAENEMPLSDVSPLYAELVGLVAESDRELLAAPVPEGVARSTQEIQDIAVTRAESQQMRSAADEMYRMARENIIGIGPESQARSLIHLLKMKYDRSIDEEVREQLLPQITASTARYELALALAAATGDVQLARHTISEAESYQVSAGKDPHILPIPQNMIDKFSSYAAEAEAKAGNRDKVEQYLGEIETHSVRNSALLKMSKTYAKLGQFELAKHYIQPATDHQIPLANGYILIAQKQPSPENIDLAVMAAREIEDVSARSICLARLARVEGETWLLDASDIEAVLQGSTIPQRKVELLMLLAPLYPERNYYELALEQINALKNNPQAMHVSRYLCMLAQSLVEWHAQTGEPYPLRYGDYLGEAIELAGQSLAFSKFDEYVDVARSMYAIADVLTEYADAKEATRADQNASEREQP